MRISIHQPAYLPWLGYLEKIRNCDKFVYLDTVQFSKNSFDNRNRIPKLNGKSQWLTIPIRHAGKYFQNYTECMPDNDCWLTSHLETIKQTYGKLPNFDKYFPLLQQSYSHLSADMNLADIDFELLKFFLTCFGIKSTEIIRASKISKIHGKGSQLVLNICKHLGADEYYSGRMGKDYLVLKEFRDSKVNVIFQEYEPTTMWSSVHQLFTRGAIL
jgi:hypothetical protein